MKRRAARWAPAALALIVAAAPGACRRERPRLAADVPVQAAQGVGEPTVAADASADLPATPARALTLNDGENRPIDPALTAGGEVWVRVAARSEPAGRRIVVSAGPDARWRVELFAGDGAAPTGDDTPLLTTRQPAPGHPLRIAGLPAAGPDGALLVRLAREWQSPDLPPSRVIVGIATDEADREAERELREGTPATAAALADGPRVHGELSHPGDQDCVRMPAPVEVDGEPRCAGALLRLSGLARRPVSLVPFGDDGTVGEARALRPPLREELPPADDDVAGYCLALGEEAAEAVTWSFTARSAPCPAADEAPVDLSAPLVVRPGVVRVNTLSLAPGQHDGAWTLEAPSALTLLEIQAGDATVAVTDPQGDPTPPLATLGRLLVLPVAPAHRLRVGRAAGDDATLSQAARATARVRGLAPRPFGADGELRPEGRLVALTAGGDASLTMPDPGVGAPAARWSLGHLGPGRVGSLTASLTDAEARPLTARTVQAGQSAAIAVPPGFGPYTLTLKTDDPDGALVVIEPGDGASP